MNKIKKEDKKNGEKKMRKESVRSVWQRMKKTFRVIEVKNLFFYFFFLLCCMLHSLSFKDRRNDEEEVKKIIFSLNVRNRWNENSASACF